MKKSGFSVLAVMFAVALIFAQTATARAQWGTSASKDRVATPMSVATLYHIMQRKLPDFAAWARETEAYKKANGFDKNVVLKREEAMLKNEFALITPFEPIVVKTQVRLSPYSEQTKGYVLEGVNDGTFFGYTFLGTNYAIVLPKLVNYEWIGMEGPQQKEVESAAEKNRRVLGLAVKVRINYADKTAVMMKEKPYFLLSGDILSVELYDRKDSDRPIWWMDSKEVSDSARQELMQLKR